VHVIENVIAVNHDTEEAECPTDEWEEKKRKEKKKKERHRVRVSRTSILQITKQTVRTQLNFGDAAGDAAGHAGFANQSSASLHPAEEATLGGIQREVIPDGPLGVRIGAPDAIGDLGGRPGRQLRAHIGVIDIQDAAEELHALDIMLLAGIRILAAISEQLPP